MTSSHDPDTQVIIALHICLGFTQQGQRLRRVDVRSVSRVQSILIIALTGCELIGCNAGVTVSGGTRHANHYRDLI